MDAEVAWILQAAGATLAAGRWCQGAEARDEQGHPAHPLAATARTFSMTGALYRASGFDGTPERRQIYQAAVSSVAAGLDLPISKWNDSPGRRLDQVLEAICSAGRRPCG